MYILKEPIHTDFEQEMLAVRCQVCIWRKDLMNHMKLCNYTAGLLCTVTTFVVLQMLPQLNLNGPLRV